MAQPGISKETGKGEAMEIEQKQTFANVSIETGRSRKGFWVQIPVPALRTFYIIF